MVIAATQRQQLDMPLDTLLTLASSNFIKDFPGLNAVNLDNIDEYAGPCLPAQALQSFSTVLLTSSSPDPVMGTGSVNTGLYYRIFDQMFLWGQFRFGTGFSAGNGIYRLQLPFRLTVGLASANPIGASPIVGSATSLDANLASGCKSLVTHLASDNSLQFSVRFSSGLANREVRESGLITWEVGDGINWSARAKLMP